MREITAGLLVILQMFPKYTKDIDMITSKIFLKLDFREINVAFARYLISQPS